MKWAFQSGWFKLSLQIILVGTVASVWAAFQIRNFLRLSCINLARGLVNLVEHIAQHDLAYHHKHGPYGLAYQPLVWVRASCLERGYEKIEKSDQIHDVSAHVNEHGSNVDFDVLGILPHHNHDPSACIKQCKTGHNLY